MHPYEAARTMRERRKHESVRLNYGSLYSVVGSLAKRGLIDPVGAERSGRLPERTVYRITEAGLIEMRDWLSELLELPIKEYPALAAALSFLSALPPAEASALLEQRAVHLTQELALGAAARAAIEQAGLPRLLWVEAELSGALRQAELDYVRGLVADIAAGTLEGLEWWQALHSEREHASEPTPRWEAGGTESHTDGEPARSQRAARETG